MHHQKGFVHTLERIQARRHCQPALIVSRFILLAPYTSIKLHVSLPLFVGESFLVFVCKSSLSTSDLPSDITSPEGRLLCLPNRSIGGGSGLAARQKSKVLLLLGIEAM